MKITFYLFLAFYFCIYCQAFSQYQYYTAELKNQELTINVPGDKSKINWGRVDKSDIKLFKISTYKD